MAKINSKQKGKTGELELVHFLKNWGFDCNRTQQYKGFTKNDNDADVIGVEGLHIECKRVEKINLEDALKQAERDSFDNDNIPTVMWRRNREEWKATLRLDKFLDIYKFYLDNKKEVKN